MTRSTRTTRTALSALFLSVGATLAHADLGDQLSRVLAGDGEAGDRFSFSVAMSGNIAIIGSFADDDNGVDSGSAYIFDISDPETPLQLRKFFPQDGTDDAGDRFGISLAINGTIALVGTDRDSSGRGRAYLFDISDPANPTQLSRISAEDRQPDDSFGFSVAMGGSPGNEVAVIGAFLDDNSSNRIDSGSVYIFDISDPENPVQTFKKTPFDLRSQDRFGISVAISDSTAIVGAYRNDAQGDDSGAAYLFDIYTGQELATLLPDDELRGENFGRSVSACGSIALIGAPNDAERGSLSGAAYLFDISDPINPTYLVKFGPDDIAERDHFGISVAISGTTVLIGSTHDDDNGEDSGSAYFFDISNPRVPVQDAKIWAEDGKAGDSFGRTAALSDGIAMIGAHLRDDDNNGVDSGAAYFFEAPEACAADLDGDCDVDADDFFTYLDLFASGDDGADIDGDGDLDADDFFAYLDLFSQGC